MGTEVSTHGGFGLAAIAAGLKRTRKSMPSFGGKQFLKFGKDGQWTIGKGGSDALNGRHVLFNMSSLKAGYVCWTDYDKKEKKKNTKLGEEMALAAMGGIDPSKLPDTGWEWKQQQGIEGRFMDKDKKEFSYTTSSLGGLEAMDGVLDVVMARIELEGEERFINPVIELADDWYDHTDWGKTYKPVLLVVGWADEDGVTEGADEGDEEPRRRTKRVEQDEDQDDEREEDQGDEPPVRRRRR